MLPTQPVHNITTTTTLLDEHEGAANYDVIQCIHDGGGRRILDITDIR